MNRTISIITGLSILVVLLSIPGCGPKQAWGGDTVLVHYTAKTEDGQIVDSSINAEPLEITLGEGQVISGFDQAVTGMKVGDNKTVTIPADQAYGLYRDDLAMKVDRDELPGNLDLEIGMQLQASQLDGNVMIFTVTGLSDEQIEIDANHPLAGHDLTFYIELIEIVTSAKDKSGSSLTSIPLEEALSSGKATLAEFGSNTCIPCKKMKPILEQLAVEYKDKVNILLIEVYDYMELTRQYEIVGIPTQIVFDENGKEITRHTGFWAKEDIIAQFREMGIE
jgi:peptidylprolyl isomerase